MSDGLDGKSVIVTGAASGVGLAAARRFVTAGAQVMMADIDEEKLEREVETLAAEGLDGQAQAFAGDLGEKLTMTNLMAATIDAHEGIDVLVNANRLLVSSDPLNAEEDRFEETLQRNVVANLRLTQIVARRMIEFAADERPDVGDRSIVNLSSVFGRRAPPEMFSYSVSCAAIEQLTRVLAAALAENRIRVNAVAIGGIMGQSLSEALPEIEDLPDALVEVVPLGRLGEPLDVAEAALFLASPRSGFITGQVLAVDGGRLLLDPLEGAAV